MRHRLISAGVFFLMGCAGSDAAAPATSAKAAVTASLVSAPIAEAVTATVSIDILALDAEQKPAVAQVVNFVVTAGGGSIFAPAVTTDGAGHARNSWTLGTRAGTQTVELRTISATGAPVVLGTASAEAKPGAAESVSLSASDKNDPAAAWIVRRARDVSEMVAGGVSDRYGNAVTNYSLSVTQTGSWTSTGTTLTPVQPWQLNRLTITVGTYTRTIDAWSIEDWRSTRWTANYACQAKLPVGGYGPLSRYAMVVDSVRYRSETALWPGPQALGVFFASGTATAADGAVSKVSRELLLWRVWADSLQIGVPSGAPNGDGRLYAGSSSTTYKLTAWTLVRLASGGSDFGPGVATGSTGASWCMPSEATESSLDFRGSTFVMTKGN